MHTNDLFYTCSLIEYIGRKMKQRRSDIVKTLGKDSIRRIYEYADVFHSDIIEKVAEEFIEDSNITVGDYDNVADCKYSVPDYWDIGEVFSRLIEDAYTDKEDLVQLIIDVYSSWISDAIENYNSDFFYQSRQYIYECYKENKICA